MPAPPWSLRSALFGAGVLAAPTLACVLIGMVLATPSTAGAQETHRCEDGCTLVERPDCCDEVCTNLQIDLDNCGACGVRCPVGQGCYGGQCIGRSGPPVASCDPACPVDQVCIVAPGSNFCCDASLACGNTCYEAPPNHCDADGTPYYCAIDKTCCAGSCCDPGELCMPSRRDPNSNDACCAPEDLCGGDCCWGDTECVDGHCRPRCEPACAPGTTCVDPGNPEIDQPPTCCSPGQIWDVVVSSSTLALCCAPDDRWVATIGLVEVAECCPAANRWEENGQCCPEERRPDPRFNCCEPGSLAAVDPATSTKICCPVGRECGGVCCDYFENCVNGACQAEGEPCTPCGSQGECCQAGERCVEDRCIVPSLSGIWMDEAAGVEVRLVEVDGVVTATYLEPRPCEHRDGTGAVTMREFNFAARSRATASRASSAPASTDRRTPGRHDRRCG